MAGFEAIGEAAIGELPSAGASLLVPETTIILVADPPAVVGGAGIAVPAFMIGAQALAPTVRAGATIRVPAAAIVVTATEPEVSDTRIDVPAAGVTVFAEPPSISTGTRIDVPLSVVVTVSASVPRINPGVWLHVPAARIQVRPPPPRLSDEATIIVVEEQEVTERSEAIGEIAIGETPPRDIIRRIPVITVGAFAPRIRGGSSINVPLVTISMAATAPQVSVRHRRPLIQIIAS